MITHPNCKINLGLHVVRRREDGYHDLETLFVPIPLCDELEITPADTFSFRQHGMAVDCDMEDNIVVRAYRMMQRRFGERIGAVAMRLDKRIPFGAGLGGGSSDAAFTLKMIDQLFNLGMSTAELQEMAAMLGADCPFFIENQPAYATGIGDHLEPIGFNPIDGYHFLLVKPDENVSTSEAYRGITPREKTGEPCPDLIEILHGTPETWRNRVANDFEESVFKGHPLLAKLKADMYAAGALYASMSGSGSSIYGIFPEKTTISFNNYSNLFIFES